MIRRLLLAALLTLAPAVRAGTTSPIVVHDPNARPTLAGAPNGIVFMVIENLGPVPDALVGASTPVARKAQVHEMTMTGNVMRMRPAGRVVIPAGGKVTLDPDGLHLMLMGMKRPLKPGDRFPLTLTFEKAGAIDLDVEVKAGR